MKDTARDPSIEDYAAIGDCRTLALVSRFGSIDWCCVPDFSSPSVFAALLDRRKGGCFAFTPRGIVRAAQQYTRGTNVLHTRIDCEHGSVVLTDFMTLPETAPTGDAPQEIVRIAECVAGSVDVDVAFEPRPDYARAQPQLQRQAQSHWRCAVATGCLDVGASFPLRGDASGVHATLAMRAGDVHVAVFTASARGTESGGQALVAAAKSKLAATEAWWRSWCDGCTYAGDRAEAVMRSALALRLLTHRQTGALVAAGTTSIPESATGARNWDYRFCWLRDASLVFDAFTELGYVRESGDFLRWLLHATQGTQPRLQVVYDMYGGHELEERELPHLCGYHGIGPVRIGNAAASQSQHDVYGEVIVTASDYVRRGGRLSDAEKALVAQFAQVACDVWREPDHGIWEIRSAPRHNTHSKLMCWAALDRALRIHHAQPLPIDAPHISRERDAIRADIDAHAWHPQLNSYAGYYGGDAPDASLLLMPRMGFVDARDPRMLGTTERVMRELAVDGLLYRFPPGTGYDGVRGGEHLFAICSFWLVDCLARQGRIDEAQELYERLLALRNPAGLYAEEFDVRSGRPVGNFPQAFTHVGSITAALSLQRAKT
jgi:GH15 family glucan-1,4-alpha-glucosidase